MEGIGLPLPWGIIPAERVRRVVPVPSPAAGADWSVAVPGGTLWVVRALKAQLATSAVVANRIPNLRVTDGTNVVCQIAHQQNITTGTTSILSWIAGWPGPFYGNLNQSLTDWFPEFPLHGGYVVGPVTANLDAGDQWSAIVATVDEYEVRGLERAWERYVDAVQAAVDAYAETIERQARRFTEALERGAHV